MIKCKDCKYVRNCETSPDTNADECEFKVVLPTTTKEWQRDMNIAYEKGRADVIDDFVKEMRKYWGGLKAMEEIEHVAEQLKEKRK